ncbi:hypothetical protein A2U01_0040103, partial [Trifolium medium]|nr:hypothetical protein [Trifolium medium]
VGIGLFRPGEAFLPQAKMSTQLQLPALLISPQAKNASVQASLPSSILP